MWKKIAEAIINYRFIWLFIILAATVVMAYFASFAQLSYNFASVVPNTDEEMIYFKKFKETFGEDANILAIGIKDEKAFKLEQFIALKELSDKINKIEGVTQVLSLPRIQYLSKDTAQKRFIPKKVFAKLPETQKELDSLIVFTKSLKFYENQLISESGATMILVSIEKKILDSRQRDLMMDEITQYGDDFTEKTGIKTHYAGVPVIRTVMSKMISAELRILLILSIAITAVVLFIFFRSYIAVIIPLAIIGILIIWTVGTIGLLGYKITILTAILPPILVVIGIPNCVYFLNMYHQEYKEIGDKITALKNVISKIGIIAFMTNGTTAIGFLVFMTMETRLLKEFGLVSGINIMATYVVSLVLFPVLLSFFPAPTVKDMKHLERTPTLKVIGFFHTLVFRYRMLVYATVTLIILLSIVGMYRIQVVSFMVDDIPQESAMRKDLRFFEANFRGVMPLEIVVDTRKEKGMLKMSNLRKINEFENELRKIPLLSPPVSMIGFVKAIRQAYYNNSPEFFDLPTNQDRPFVLGYLQQSKDTSGLINAFVDSLGQNMRISLKVADIGSVRMDSLIQNVLQPKIDEVFKDSELKAHITGTTLLFIKGNAYLVDNLKSSILLAIFLISILMAFLFKNFRIILIITVTNLVPLFITAGLMGFLDVPLKPSTALIFSITFGIAVDDAIHYLAHYRMAFKEHPEMSIKQAVAHTLDDMAAGMIYTSVVLFFGFIIFIVSDFQGTVALGLLTSTTLICAMFGNLILLPSLLVDFDRKRKLKNKAV